MMEKPRAAAIRLYELGYLHGITVEYRPTGDDTATSFVTIKGSNGTAQGLLKTYEEFLELKFDHNAIARLAPRFKNQKSWRSSIV